MSYVACNQLALLFTWARGGRAVIYHKQSRGVLGELCVKEEVRARGRVGRRAEAGDSGGRTRRGLRLVNDDAEEEEGDDDRAHKHAHHNHGDLEGCAAL